MEAIEKFFDKILGKKEPTDNRILFGIALVLFGLLFFGKELHILRSNTFLLSLKMCALYMTLIFLFGRQYKFAVLFGGLAVIAWMPQVLDLMGKFSNFIIPTIFLVLGGVLIFVAKKKKEGDASKSSDEPAKNVEHQPEEVKQEESTVEPLAPLETDYTRYQPHSEEKTDEPEDIKYN